MAKLPALGCGLILVVVGAAKGQEARTPELRKVSQIVGSSVLLQDGVNYGKVEDIVLNEDGCIEYVVVSREDRFALMPWAVARVDYGQRALTFNATPQAVQPLFFARDAWPNVADPQFGSRVQEAFGPRAVPRGARPESARPGPAAPRPAERSKAEAREKKADAPQSPDQPRAKVREPEKKHEGPRPADPPKGEAKGKGADAPPTDRPKAKDQPKGREKSERP